MIEFLQSEGYIRFKADSEALSLIHIYRLIPYSMEVAYGEKQEAE